jgi:hypothetical protein
MFGMRCPWSIEGAGHFWCSIDEYKVIGARVRVYDRLFYPFSENVLFRELFVRLTKNTALWWLHESIK